VVDEIEAVRPRDDESAGLERLLSYVVGAMRASGAVILAVELCRDTSLFIQQVRHAEETAIAVEDRLVDEGSRQVGLTHPEDSKSRLPGAPSGGITELAR
jgi:hypothetical protein